jgi:RecJ-like exonuclease
VGVPRLPVIGFGCEPGGTRVPVSTHEVDPEQAPGDEAPTDENSAGENTCPECDGTGERDGQPCENCGGSGKIVEAIGGG